MDFLDFLKYAGWLLPTFVGFAGDWIYQFTEDDKEKPGRKRLTKIGKTAVWFAAICLCFAMTTTYFEQVEAKAVEKKAAAENVAMRARIESLKAELSATIKAQMAGVSREVAFAMFLASEPDVEGKGGFEGPIKSLLENGPPFTVKTGDLLDCSFQNAYDDEIRKSLVDGKIELQVGERIYPLIPDKDGFAKIRVAAPLDKAVTVAVRNPRKIKFELKIHVLSFYEPELLRSIEAVFQNKK